MSCCRRNYGAEGPAINRHELVCQAMKGSAEAQAVLLSHGLDWTQMVQEQAACKKSENKMMTYGAVAAGIGALAYFMSKDKSE